MASTTAELTWLLFLLRYIGLYLDQTPILFCDNISTLHLTINHVFRTRTKHIELDNHFVREKVALESLVTKFVSSPNQVANIFTKALPKQQFQMLISKLSLSSPTRPNLRGVVEESHASQQAKGSTHDKAQLAGTTHIAQLQFTQQDKIMIEPRQDPGQQRSVCTQQK